MGNTLVLAELERDFEAQELAALGVELLGVDARVLSGSTRAELAAQLVDHCEKHEALEALADAMVLRRPQLAAQLLTLRHAGSRVEEGLGPGDRLGEYRLEAELGSGPAAVVYRARAGSRAVRLKLLRRSVAAAAAQRFLTATRAAGSAGERWLPQLAFAGPIDDRHVVVHQAAEGEPFVLGAAGPMSFADAWPLVRRVLTGLAALHGAQLAHGALHANNLLVAAREDGPAPVLLDAGAHYLRGQTLVGGLATGEVRPLVAAWASPEQLRGQLPTPRSDVFSIGLWLYALLAGRLPWAPTDPELAKRRFAAEPEPLGFLVPSGRLAPGLDELVLELIDPAPGDRPPHASAVLELLVPFAAARSPSGGLVPEEALDTQIARLLAEPASEEARGVLESAIDQGAEPRRVAEALLLAADQLDDEGAARAARRGLLVRAGAIFENLMGDTATAARVYRQVLDANRADDGARTALERVLRRRGEFAQVVELLLDQRDALDEPVDRARVLGKLGHLLSTELDDREQALVALTAAAAEDPTNDGHALALERAVGSDPASWATALATLAESADTINPERRVALLERMGHWYDARLGRPDLALECHRAVVALDPLHDVALDRIEEIYRRGQLYGELGHALLARAATAAAPPRARDLRVEAAAVFMEHGGPENHARQLLEQVLSEDPGHRRAAEALSALYLRTGSHRDWVELMERRADAAEGGERTRLLLELARGLETRLDDPDRALLVWEQVVADDPSHVAALDALERGYLRAGLPEKARATLERRLQIALTPAQRVSLLGRIATLSRTELLDDRAASDALERLLDIDPSSEPALEALAHAYRRQRLWDALARTLERHAEHAPSAARGAELWVQAGELAEAELGDEVRALFAYDSALRLCPDDRTALDKAATLRASRGDAESAALALDNLARQATSPEQRAEAWLKAGNMLQQLGDDSGAEQRYRSLLDELPGHPIAARKLARLLANRGQLGAATTLLERSLSHAASSGAAAQLGAALGRLWLDEARDPARAAVAANLALERDPSNPDVRLLCGDIERHAQAWAAACEHYEQALAGVSRLDADSAVRLLAHSAEALQRSGDAATARGRLASLVERSEESLVAAAFASRLSVDLETPQLALELTDRLLDHHEKSLTLDDVCQAHLRRGRLLQQLAQPEAAVSAFEHALVANRRSVDALRELVVAHQTLGQRDELRATLERLHELALLDEDQELLLEVGDAYAERLSDLDAATQVYVEALTDSESDRKILLRMLRIHSDAQDFQRVVVVVLRLAKLASGRRDRARYLQTAARITVEELDDPAEALVLYDRALEADPNSESIVTETLALRSKVGDVAGVRRILEAQIARASARQDKERAYLWATRLADVHLGELDVADAIAINESALRLVPSDPARENVLAELYLTDAKQYLDRAAALARRVLARDPRAPDGYRRLFDLSLGAERRDAAWCAAQVLVVLGAATPAEDEYFRGQRRAGPLELELRISDEEYRSLIAHPFVNPTLTSLLSQIQPVVADSMQRYSLSALGLREEDALTPENCQGTLVRAFQRVSDALRIPLPLFFEADSMAPMTLRRSARPLVLLSRSAAQSELPRAPAGYMAASCLSLLRPGYYLRTLLPPAELKAWVLAAIRLVTPNLPVPAEIAESLESAGRSLARHLDDRLEERVRRLVEALLAAGGQADLTRWIAGVDLSCDRVGLVFCGDLATCSTAVRRAAQTPGATSAEERERALLTYAVSSEYLRLRHRLLLSTDLTVEELSEDDIASPARA